MSSSSTARLPRAGLDPIRDEDTALALVSLAATDPVRDETILVLLDADRRGVALVVVGGTDDPDAVVDVADRVLDPAVHGGRVAATVVASVRPDRGRHDTADAHELADAERWLELDATAAEHGVELVEWLVLDAGVSRPRQLVNAPPRW